MITLTHLRDLVAGRPQAVAEERDVLVLQSDTALLFGRCVRRLSVLVFLQRILRSIGMFSFLRCLLIAENLRRRNIIARRGQFVRCPQTFRPLLPAKDSQVDSHVFFPQVMFHCRNCDGATT